MNGFDWTYRFAGIVIYCTVPGSEVRDVLRLSNPTAEHLPEVRAYYEPIVRERVFEAGAAYGEEWNFSSVGGQHVVSRVDPKTGWVTS